MSRSSDDGPRAGTVIDRFTLVRLLGRGGMGAVYEARHAQTARRFAIKFLLPELATNPEALRRFENEAKLAGGLEHPNLVAVIDVGRAEDGAPYLVMEFLEGEDGAKLLRRAGPLPIARAVEIVVQACRGIAVAHRRDIVHRDLKPENLFLTEAGDGSDLVKVLDFGIAKLRPPSATASAVTARGATFGTAFYMSPEQARSAADVDPRTDVWSLGVVLYELLSGRKPFEGEELVQVIHQILTVEPAPVTAHRPDVPAALAAVVDRALAKEVARRLPSVAAFAEALLPFARHPAAARAPASAFVRTLPTADTAGPGAVARTARAPRRRAVVVAGAVAAVAVLGTAAWVAWGGRRRPLPAAAVTEPVQPRPPSVDARPPPVLPSVALPAPAPPAPPAPAKNVRTVPERFEHASHRRRTRSSVARSDAPGAVPAAPALGATAASKPVVPPRSPDPTPSGDVHPVDPESPY